jgi:hypothetical protein
MAQRSTVSASSTLASVRGEPSIPRLKAARANPEPIFDIEAVRFQGVLDVLTSIQIDLSWMSHGAQRI